MRPNLLVIITDQQSSSMMSCAGNANLQTPAMDSLAETGVRFDRAYCTNPVCVPSRFSLFTGHMPSLINLRNNVPGPDAALPDGLVEHGLGHRLKAAGYAAVYAGKEHLPLMRTTDLGFDYVCKDERQILSDFAADWLRNAPDQPFCLVTSFINPHDICYMPLVDSQRNERERHFARSKIEPPVMKAAAAHPEGMDDETFFRDVCPPLPANFEPQSEEPEVIQDMFDDLPCRKMCREEWSERRWREYRWCYKNLTEKVDGEIQQVLDALHASDLAENTVVIFTSDHGDMGGAHRLPHKEVLYEETCRIPLIVRDPLGGRTGEVESRLISNGLDLIPTLCDYAGAEPPPGLAGRSLKPLVRGEAPEDWRELVPIENDRGRAIVTDRRKYVRCFSGENAEQLYDLELNPGEMKNDAADPAYRHDLMNLRDAFDEVFET